MSKRSWGVQLVLLALSGCAGHPAPPRTAEPVEPADSRPVQSSEPQEPESSVEAAHTAALAPQALIQELDETEKQELDQHCKPLVKAFQNALARSKAFGRLGMILDGQKQTLASPPALPVETRDRCLSLFQREMGSYLIDSLGVEARVTLQSLGRAMSDAVERNGKLCPSSAAPVPASVPEFHAKVDEAAWSAPTWSCLGGPHLWDRLSIQIEVTSDATTGTGTFRARGAPFQDGRLVEWKLDGKLESGKFVFGKASRSP